jgi:hypothetical protein
MTPRPPTPSGAGGLPRHPRGATRPHGDEVPHVGGQVPNDPRRPRAGGESAPGATPDVGHQPRGVPRHPQRATSRPASPQDAGGLACGADSDSHHGVASRRRVRTGPLEVHHHPRGAGDLALAVRLEVRLVGGAAGRALAAAQGRALSALLASVAELEVGQGEEVSP